MWNFDCLRTALPPPPPPRKLKVLRKCFITQNSHRFLLFRPVATRHISQNSYKFLLICFLCNFVFFFFYEGWDVSISPSASTTDLIGGMNQHFDIPGRSEATILLCEDGEYNFFLYIFFFFCTLFQTESYN